MNNLSVGRKYYYYNEASEYSFKEAYLELLETYVDSEAPSFAAPPPWVTYYKFKILSAIVGIVPVTVNKKNKNITFVLTECEVDKFIFADEESFNIISSVQDFYL